MKIRNGYKIRRKPCNFCPSPEASCLLVHKPWKALGDWFCTALIGLGAVCLCSDMFLFWTFVMGKRFFSFGLSDSERGAESPSGAQKKLHAFANENTKSVCRLLTSEEGVQASNLLSDKVINYLIRCIKLDGSKNYSQLGNALQVIFGILHLSLGPWGHEGYWEVETLNMEHGVVWSGKDETQRTSGCSKLCQKKLQSQWGQRFT